MVGPRGEIWRFRRPKTRFSNTLFHHKLQGTPSQTYQNITHANTSLISHHTTFRKYGIRSVKTWEKATLVFCTCGARPPFLFLAANAIYSTFNLAEATLTRSHTLSHRTLMSCSWRSCIRLQNVEARRDRDRRGLCGRSLRRSVFRACGSWWIDEELTCAIDHVYHH